MALPGVPRNRRIKFVEQLVHLLLEEGLEGITEHEHNGLGKMMKDCMDSVTPIPEELEEDSPEKKPGGC